MQNYDTSPLYNSRITQTYIDYLRATYPALQIDSIMQQAGMTNDEVADAGHWFSQDQVDRFHEVLVAETGDENIARHAGRFGASAKSANLLKQYIIGLVNIESVFASMARLVPLLSKGAAVEVKKLGAGVIEIVSKPNPGVHEKRYQCENRLGTFEAIPKLFTNYYAHIEHPACFHRGDAFCRYIVTWNTSTSLKLRLVRNYSILASAILLGISLFSLPAIPMLFSVTLLIGFNLLVSIAYAHQKSKELEKVIETHHKIAEEQMDSVNTGYNNALLVQEIGQATAAIFDIHALMNKLALLMQKRLPFDRGVILLADATGKRLVYTAGYGYGPDEKSHLDHTEFQLVNPESRGAFVRAFLDQKYLVVNNISDIEDKLSSRSIELARHLHVRSLLCVPIVFEKRSLGILAVDNVHTKAPLKKSDVNLLQGIASHIAISINNSRSFQKLHESEARYRQTVESLLEGYFELDCRHTIVFANNALCELLDCTFDELMGKRFDRFFAADIADQIGDLFKSIKEDRRTVRFAHFKMSKLSGGLFPVDLSASMICDTNGQFTGIRGLIRDATDRLKMEKEKLLLENRLLQAQKMEAIGTLAGGIAHNFNNWLNGILGNITLIRIDSQQNSKITARVGKIEHIIDSASRMTQQLLGYARRGKYKVDLIDINQVIQESSDTLSVTRKDIAISLKLDPDVAAVKADKNQIEQVLWNLYINALDAMSGGGKLEIETTNTTFFQGHQSFGFEVQAGDYVCVSITDSGMGIDPEFQESIFEPFFTTKNGTGTGLGLASVYGIVKAHGGYIDVKSSRGKGSTFHVFLPSANEILIAGQEPGNQTIRTGHETILLVDDDEMVLDTCRELLNGLGYKTVTAQNGEQALEIYAARGNMIDLVVIDMIMPGMSGKDLFARLKGTNPNIKTLLSSGYSLNEQAQEILNSGCNGFIQKPYNIAHFSAMIRNIINSEHGDVRDGY